MAGINLIVFRDSSKQVSANDIAADLITFVQQIRVGDPASVADALILAGQIESALSDGEWPCSEKSCLLTDALADWFVERSPHETNHTNSLITELLQQLPEFLRISEPEGFAYYALHPADFADVVGSITGTASIALIGIRSIGTTLSAIAMAQLRKQNVVAFRTTVRPVGHPYDRQTDFTASQAEWITQHKSSGSTFLVLDEGPGLSGSSFLSVGESLINSGVQAEKIILIGTRQCTPGELCTRNAAQRWSKFEWRTVSSRIQKRFADHVRLQGGSWRSQLPIPPAEWPATWMEMATLRFLTPDRSHILKFEGFGRVGRDTLERAQRICKAGFGPVVENAGDGMHSYHFIDGHPLSIADLSSDLLDQIARYCAFRANEFSLSTSRSDRLKEMLEFNFMQEFGEELNLPMDDLECDTSVQIDGKMQPYEWISARSGAVLKIDAVQHGDDHFLPGPTDIAWDLAGAIVEWNMCNDAAQRLCERFHGYAVLRRIERLPYFVLAYSVFRLAYCKMAMQATRDFDEETRFRRSYLFYRRKANQAAYAVVPASSR